MGFSFRADASLAGSVCFAWPSYRPSPETVDPVCFWCGVALVSAPALTTFAVTWNQLQWLELSVEYAPYVCTLQAQQDNGQTRCSMTSMLCTACSHGPGSTLGGPTDIDL